MTHCQYKNKLKKEKKKRKEFVQILFSITNTTGEQNESNPVGVSQ